MSLDVLFVDDDYDLAKEWSSYIAEHMAVSTQATGDSEEALAILKHTGIKVAILDQKMAPQMNGTALGAAMREVDSRVRLILLSGQATVAEVQLAYDSVFERAIHKNDALAKLPVEISRQLLEYNKSLRSELALAKGPAISAGPKSWRLQNQLKYKLLGIDHVDSQFIFPDSWQARIRIDTGIAEEHEFAVEWTRSNEIQLENQIQASSEMKLSTAKLAALHAAVKDSVTTKEQVRNSLSEKRFASFKKKVTLPAEPIDPSTLHIRARSYQVAPVYLRVGVTIARICECCGALEPLKANIFFPTTKASTQQVDYYSDGTSKVTATGMEDAG